MSSRYFIFFFLWWTCLYGSAQSPYIQSITVADGLSQGFVTTIYQDSHGFMWFGTLDGLNRYDGYSIRRYNYQPFSRFSLSGSAYITRILESSEGLLWIGTDEFLYVFDPATERFFNVSQHVPLLPRHGVMQIVMDSSGTLIVMMENPPDSTALYHLYIPDHFALQLRYGSEPLAGVHAAPLPLPPGAGPLAALQDCVGDTMILAVDWAGRAYRLMKPAFQFMPADVLNWQTPNPTILWGKDYGFFYRRKPANGSYTHLPPHIFRRLVPLKDGTCLLISGVDHIIYKFDTSQALESSHHIDPYGTRPERKDFTPFMEFPHQISTILQDQSDVIWVGTGGYGLEKVSLRNQAFRHFVPGNSLYNFREMPDGRIWPGKFLPNKLIDPNTGILQPAPWASFFTYKNYIYNMLPDRQGNLWFTSAGERSGKLGSIYFWEKKTGRYREMARLHSFKESIVEQLLEDRQGNIWVAAHDGHLFQCRADVQQATYFSYSSLFSDFNKNLTANAMCEDADGNCIWIGTSRGLVELQHPAGNRAPAFRLFEYQADNPQSLAWNWVLCLYQNPAVPNLLWIGTRGGGLNCYDKNTGFFHHFTTEDGLADNVVYGIVPDDEGNLWCSTNRGLSRFQPSTGIFVNYYESDGLQANEFNTGAFLRNRQGLLLFGGVNGLTVFDPKEIKLSSKFPPVAITGIKVRGNPLLPAREGSPLQFAPYYDQRLKLPFSENNVTFEFAALDFANPATNRFRYKMNGIDREWIHAGTTHFANYASLPPGEYVFEVQAATADGDWNPKSARFLLIIAPPWYRTWLAYLCYLLFGAGLVWGYIRLREERLREQHLLQLKNRESERLKELDSFKNRLFANITHEFRTPLTIILGLAERLRKGKSQQDVVENAGNIITQGNNLLDLVNQVLDLAKLESQGLTLRPVQSNLSTFVRFQAESFQSMATYNNIKIELQTEKPDVVMDFDPQRFRQVLTNLLSNAIRHTPPDGRIKVSLFRKESQQVVLEVADSGAGIAPEELPYIFDRFFQGKISEQKQGTGGIGLALTHELVLLAGGDIRVESIPGQGATFTVTLPVTNLAEPTPFDRITAQPAMFTPGLTKKQEKGDLPLLLVIEDNPVVADYLRSCLHDYYNLLFAENGHKGIQTAFDKIPDIILSDVMMPVQDGLEVTQILKNDERTSHIPIVLLTAKTQSEDRLDALRLGANAYLTKPFLEEELLLVLNNKLILQQVWKQRYAAFEKGMPVEMNDEVHQSSDIHTFKMEDEFMKKLFRIFEENYHDEHFHLEQLCRLAGMSSSQLHRKLTALTDQPVMQMLRAFRLHKARELLLARPDLQVTEVALMTGFNNPAHFSRVFSQTFGQPPSALKK
ncbi:MAG TPA: two-component regulator propeller domain-containing protein [Saprospiraceae bacterium]|nr:two-component regulator propeller domain-containing protein [Saprospiraceae bacterium]